MHLFAFGFGASLLFFAGFKFCWIQCFLGSSFAGFEFCFVQLVIRSKFLHVSCMHFYMCQVCTFAGFSFCWIQHLFCWIQFFPEFILFAGFKFCRNQLLLNSSFAGCNIFADWLLLVLTICNEFWILTSSYMWVCFWILLIWAGDSESSTLDMLLAVCANIEGSLPSMDGFPELPTRPKTKLPVQKQSSHPSRRPLGHIKFKSGSFVFGLAALFSICPKQSANSIFWLPACFSVFYIF